MGANCVGGAAAGFSQRRGAVIFGVVAHDHCVVTDLAVEDGFQSRAAADIHHLRHQQCRQRDHLAMQQIHIDGDPVNSSDGMLLATICADSDKPGCYGLIGLQFYQPGGAFHLLVNLLSGGRPCGQGGGPPALEWKKNFAPRAPECLFLDEFGIPQPRSLNWITNGLLTTERCDGSASRKRLLHLELRRSSVRSAASTRLANGGLQPDGQYEAKSRWHDYMRFALPASISAERVEDFAVARFTHLGHG